MLILCPSNYIILTIFVKNDLFVRIINSLFLNYVAVLVVDSVLCCTVSNTGAGRIIGCCDGDHNIILAVCDIVLIVDIKHRIGCDYYCRIDTVGENVLCSNIFCLVGSNNSVCYGVILRLSESKFATAVNNFVCRITYGNTVKILISYNDSYCTKVI